MLLMVMRLVAVDFAIVDFSCAFGVIVIFPGTRILTYRSNGTEMCRV